MIKQHFMLSLIILIILTLLIYFNPFELFRAGVELKLLGYIFSWLTFLFWSTLTFLIILTYTPPEAI